MDEGDELDAARHRFPVGDTVTGRVVDVLRYGLFVDLGEPPTGFVDVLLLPHDDQDRPDVGTVAAFEVIQHRMGQIRLSPLGGAIPPPSFVRFRATDEEWSARTARHPVGSEVTGTVTSAYVSNREYAVEFGDDRAWAEWRANEQAPTVGDSRRYRVVRHIESVRCLVVAPVDPVEA